MFANRSCRTVVLGIAETIYTLKKYTAREMVITYDDSVGARCEHQLRIYNLRFGVHCPLRDER